MKLYSDERKISFSIADKIMIIRKARDSGKIDRNIFSDCSPLSAVISMV